MFRACLVGFLFIAAIPMANAQTRKLDDEVKKILVERLGFLREAAGFNRELYQMGRISWGEVDLANRAVAVAELELAPNREERIRVRETLLKSAQETENSVKARYEGGQSTLFDLKSAQAARLRAQADLLIERKATP